MAQFNVAAVFSSNMVLQREKNICVFGEGEDNRTVTIQFDDKTYKVKVKQERWSIILPPMTAGNGYTMTVFCEKQMKQFKNISIGEVWLAGGQSNMEYELQNCTGGQEMLKEDNSNVRFYYTNKMAFIDDNFYENEAKTCWKEFNEENAKLWSAVGYSFAKKLALDLGVTVGVINCNWGGTLASCWMDDKSLREDVELSTYMDEYYKVLEGKSEENQIREYKEYVNFHAEWEKKCSKLYEENPDITFDKAQEIIGKCLYPGPNSCMNPNRPNGLYQTMLKRLAPYTIRGFLYYQGEDDCKQPHKYQKLLTRLIKLWRSDWEDQTLPFLLVQLPMHRYKENPDDKSWCLLREAQMNTYQTVKNTGIAVIIDCGEFNEIHPKNKQPVGERLELQALHHVYGKIQAKEAFGPIFKSFVYKENGMELSFDYAQDGFEVRGELGAFEIAGDDMEFKSATFELRDSKIFVYSKEVPDPKIARYCWSNYCEVSVFGKNGLPLAPFRTNAQQKN